MSVNMCLLLLPGCRYAEIERINRHVSILFEPPCYVKRMQCPDDGGQEAVRAVVLVPLWSTPASVHVRTRRRSHG